MKIQRWDTWVLAALLATAPIAVVRAGGPERHVRIDQENFERLSCDDQERVLAIADRLEEITQIDRSTLTKEERVALRTETRALKNEADAYNRAGGTVVYISTGGIIIILLLILILT